MSSVIILIGIILASLASIVLADLDVCLKDLGCMRGTMLPGYKKESFEAFMSIPYAQPPIGKLRFRNPVAATGWAGILNASVISETCLQKIFFMPTYPVFGNEDCLYLNVYRPIKRSERPLPVIVYVHGGGLFCGSGSSHSSGPEYFMDTQQVIVVTVNYRLGPFGFLSTGDSYMSGNFGLKDQRLALQWVQQHIAAFGGDSQLVTLMGYSAGAIATHYHMLSPNSKGLFQRVMSLSGTAFMTIAWEEDPLSQARQLAEYLGIVNANSLNTEELAGALREVDGLTFLEAGIALKHWNTVPIMNYGVVVEPGETPDVFMIETSREALLAGRITQVPWLLSFATSAGEGSIFLMHIYENPQLVNELNANFLELFGLLLNLPRGTSVEIVKNILNVYEVSTFELNEETFPVLCAILGDFIFIYPIYMATASYATYAKESVSIYQYEYISPSNISFVEALVGSKTYYTNLGATHMSDSLHIIHTPFLIPEYPKNSEDELVIERMASLIVEFAKTGKFYNESIVRTCKAMDFTNNGICNYLHIGQQNGKYSESVGRSIDLRALPIWKEIYLNK